MHLKRTGCPNSFYAFIYIVHSVSEIASLAISNNLKNIEINGRQLHYIEQGEDQQQQSPVIFIHGGLDDYRCWQFQVDSFSKKYRSISYSRRFAYPNKWIGNVAQDNTVQDNARDLAEIIRKLDLAPAHLVGASYGAFIALYCASKNPELAKTMVLNEPPIMEFLAGSHLKDDVELLQRFIARVQRPSQDAFKRGDFEKGVQVFMDTIMNMENFFENLHEEGKHPIMDNAKSLESELESAMSTSFTIEDVKQITRIPTLLVKGELSPQLFLRIVDILSENMPNNTEQIVIPNVSHDDFKLGTIFTSKVIEFFARHD
jgi:pimeloyl-ACP methyl ester carboxylesterase